MAQVIADRSPNQEPAMVRLYRPTPPQSRYPTEHSDSAFHP